MHPDRRRPAGPVIGQVYVTCAILALVAVPLPLYLSTDNSVGLADVTLWREAFEEGRGFSVIGLVFVALTAGLLFWAAGSAIGSARRTPPALVLAASVPAVAMVPAHPAQPSAAVFGPGLTILLVVTLVAAAAAVVHLWRITGR